MIGEITLLAFKRAPDHLLPCDGRELMIDKYKELFAVIGNIYGGNGTTTFRIPKIVSDINGPITNTYWFIHVSDEFPDFD